MFNVHVDGHDTVTANRCDWLRPGRVLGVQWRREHLRQPGGVVFLLAVHGGLRGVCTLVLLLHLVIVQGLVALCFRYQCAFMLLARASLTS